MSSHKPLFIAISGKKGSGKDEFAKSLMGYLTVDFNIKEVEITHFADPLKEMCVQLFGLDRRLVYGSNADKERLTTVLWDGFPESVCKKYSIKKEVSSEPLLKIAAQLFTNDEKMDVPRTGPMTHRELLQVMGTDIFRERVYNNIWAEYPFKQLWYTGEPCDVIIPTDVVMIADCRFPNEVTETLKNGGLVVRINRDTGHTDAHASETALNDYDWNQDRHFVIDNNGTLQEFREKAFRMAATIAANYLEKK